VKTEKIVKYIVSWLKDYATKAKMDGFIVGVSGGIDSAVVSTIAAMTEMKTLALEMPIHQKIDQDNRAQEHTKFLKTKFTNVESQRVDLTPVFDSFRKQVDTEIDLPNKNLSLANSRSRIRMLTLYYFGQINNLLVTGTGNKIEDFGVGFFTKYGDGGVDISPIADLLKTEVYEIAKYLYIPESIQKAEPTDGLWEEDRNDESQLGATYSELEWAMKVYNKHNEKDFSGREKEVFRIYDKLHKATKHKISPIPICKIPRELKD